MRTPNKLVGTIFGGVYLLIGVLGFFVTSGVGFADRIGKPLIVFPVNPLHNIVHLLIGALLLYGGLRLAEGGAARINTLVGAVYLVVGVIGLFIANPNNAANILALDAADNVLHFASALVLLGVGLGARASARARA